MDRSSAPAVCVDQEGGLSLWAPVGERSLRSHSPAVPTRNSYLAPGREDPPRPGVSGAASQPTALLGLWLRAAGAQGL